MSKEKQIEEYEKRIVNQREELRRLNKSITDLKRSRDTWKKQAERVGKQLHEVLSKQSKGLWRVSGDMFKAYFCSECGYSVDHSHQKTQFCPNCGAKIKGGAE